MALTFWEEKGRCFAFDVLTGLESARVFRPQDAIDEWLDLCDGSGLSPFGDYDNAPTDEMMELVRLAAAAPGARQAFAEGYRAALAETRTARKLASRSADTHAH